jgi:hypothetical protein
MKHTEYPAIAISFFGFGILVGALIGVGMTTFRFNAWHYQEHGYYYLEPTPGMNWDGSAEPAPPA